MAEQSFRAIILGIPHIPTVKEVNVRASASTNADLMFKTPLGIDTKVRRVEPDFIKTAKDGKIYQWFELEFPDGRIGWVRDDLIEIYGDGTAFGYGVLSHKLLAFALKRLEIAAVQPSPVPPALPVTPPPVPVTPIVPVTPLPPIVNVVQGQAWAICRAKTGVNVRAGAGTSFNPPLGRLNFEQRAEIVGAEADRDGTRFKWIKLNINGMQGFVREDFLRFEGDTEHFGAGHNDLYPAPIPRSWWVRDFNPKPIDSRLGVEHWGWDFGGDVGSPILAGPLGGTVTFVNRCQRCTPSAPSTLSQGLGLGHPSVFSDPAWGFGYGTYVIVRYDHEMVPKSTQNSLQARGLTGAHLFVMYAHLADYSVQTGQTLTPNQQIGGCGNTGNSEAPHLHLEVRAGRNKTDAWSSLFPNLLDPIVLFRR